MHSRPSPGPVSCQSPAPPGPPSLPQTKTVTCSSALGSSAQWVLPFQPAPTPTCPVPGQGADASGRVPPRRSAWWRRHSAPSTKPRDLLQKGTDSFRQGMKGSWRRRHQSRISKWGAGISRGINGRLGGRWNTLGKRNHLGKAGGWVAGKRKREEGTSIETLPDRVMIVLKARLSPGESAGV